MVSRRTVLIVVFLALLAALFFLPAYEPPGVEGRRTGNVCPEIAGADADGKPVKLSDYQGKVVLVSFWGTWCPPCRKLIPHEIEMVDGKYKGRPFVMLGVAQDAPERLAEFLKIKPLPWANIADGQPGIVARQWDVGGFPAAILVDHKGLIRRLWLEGGLDPDAVWAAVDKAVRAAEQG